MFALIILVFVMAAAVIVWACIRTLFFPAPLWVRLFLCCCLGGAAITAFFTTYRYSHFPNANTEFVGWPVPIVVFQRDGPDAPWLDFLGATVFLAYPMNLILFAILPAILTLVLNRLFRRGN